MIVETKPLIEVTRDAIKVLSKEIGIVNTVRFINQFTTGYGNYTEDRRQMFSHMSLEDIVDVIKRSRGRGDA